jgi:hypothetical protein
VLRGLQSTIACSSAPSNGLSSAPKHVPTISGQSPPWVIERRRIRTG